MATNRLLILLIPLVFLFTLSAWIQSNTLLNWDVSYLMHASEKLLRGGTYPNDFFETNPPMILFLYIPPVLASKWLGLDLVMSMRLYIFLLIGISILFCWRLGQVLFAPSHDESPFFIIIVSLAITFLLLPAYEFGQREHITIVLVFPYLLLSALRLTGARVPLWTACLAGFMAGVGFGIKPYFLIPLCLVEISLIIYTRKLVFACRPETLVILTVLVSYLGLVWTITPEYLTVIVPLLFKLYYAGFGKSFTELLLRERVLYFIASFIFCLVCWSQKSFREIRLVLLVAGVGFAIAYFFEGTFWFYHLLPVLSLSIILTAFLCTLQFPLRLNTPILTITHAAYWTAILWFPAFLMVNYNQYAIQERMYGHRHDLIQSLKTLSSAKTVYCLSTNAYHYPAIVDYAGKISVSRFPNYWWLPGLIKQSQHLQSDAERTLLTQQKNRFVQTIIDDIEHSQPDLLFIDARRYNQELGGENIDYLHYFASPTLNTLVSQYHLILHVEDFDIYERNAAVLRS